MKCLIPECNGKARARGLCMRCYNAALSVVKRGGVSWDTLIEQGFASESQVKLGNFRTAIEESLGRSIDAVDKRRKQSLVKQAAYRKASAKEVASTPGLTGLSGMCKAIELIEGAAPIGDPVERAMERAAVKMAEVCERIDQDNWGTPDAQPRREPEPAAPPCDPDLDGDESFVDPLRPVDEAFDPPTGVSQAEVQSAEKVWPVDKVATEPATALMEDWQYDGSTGSDVEKKHDAQDTPVKPTGINGFNSPGTCPPVEPAKARRGRRKTAEEFAEAPAEPETKKPWEVV